MSSSLIGRLMIGLALAAFGSTVLGAEFKADKNVRVPAEQTIQDDFYAAAETITIDGIVEGDLIAFAKDIIINGEVRGDVIAIAQSIEAAGTLGDDVRIAGQAIKLGDKAKISGDVIAAGFSLETEKDNSIAGDFVFAGYQALLAGKIDKDLLARLANLQMAGRVGGDAKIFSDSNGDAPPPGAFTGGQQPRITMPNVPGGLTIDGSTEVGGKLTYTSKGEAKVADGAKITGGVSHLVPQARPEEPNQAPQQHPVLKLLISRLKHIFCAGLIGLVVVLLMPKSSLAWADNIRTRPLASFGGGVLGFFGFFIIAIGLVIATVVITVGVGVANLDELVPTVLVGGLLGSALLIFVFCMFAAFLAEGVVGLAIGRVFMRGDGFAARLAAFLVGLALVGMALSFPYVGGVLAFIVFLFGLGGYTLWLCGMEPVSDGVSQTASPPPPPHAPAKG